MVAEWTTPDLCDEFSDSLQVLEPILYNFGGVHRFCGEIETIKCHEDNSLVKEQLGQPGQGRVMVVDGGGSTRCALLGDQLALKAIENDWHGLVIFGCIRDVDLIAEMPLGVQALGAIPIKSVRQGRGDLSVPLRFAGVVLTPKDFIYADNNGIIVAPHKIV